MIKLWPWFVLVALIALVLYGAYHMGRTTERAVWEPRFNKANSDKLVAEAKAEVKTKLAQELSTVSDERYANTILRLNERAVDVSRDMRALSLRIATLSSRSSEVLAVPGRTSEVDGTAEIKARSERAADSFTRIGSNCEADAAQVEALQNYLNDLKRVSDSIVSLP